MGGHPRASLPLTSGFEATPPQEAQEGEGGQAQEEEEEEEEEMLVVGLQEGEEREELLVGLLLQGGPERGCSHKSRTRAQRGCGKHWALSVHQQSSARSRALQVAALTFSCFTSAKVQTLTPRTRRRCSVYLLH